jgi:predicted unusual protein kinase regulating ubiquinone biosynthesis (AarF/ABC1/UbiB family)
VDRFQPAITASVNQTGALTKSVWVQFQRTFDRLCFAFADVHPGNVLISRDLERASLANCESICQLGASLDDHVPIRRQFSFAVDDCER